MTWRDLLPTYPVTRPPAQNPQNAQNGDTGGAFAHSADIAGGGQAIRTGSRVTWQRADDLTLQTGIVDYLYTDDTDTRWAFVTVGESWAAVNLKFVKGGLK